MTQAQAIKTRMAVVALIVFQFLFVAAYVVQERTIYFWDHAMYFTMARQFYEISSQSFSGGWDFFRQSLANNYNLIFALPSLISFELFGPARLVFILTNFTIFFLLYEWALALLLRRTLDLSWSAALIASFASALLVPPLWLPLLEGYPDSGAAACIVWAAAIGWNRPKDWQPLLLRGLIVGVTLGCAVLLRRHFVYPAIGFLITSGCFALWDIYVLNKKRMREFWRVAAYFCMCGFGFIGILVFIAPDFLHAALTVHYGDLYLSYTRPALVFIRFVLGGFGFGLLLIASSGLVLLARYNVAGCRLAIFVTLFTVLWLMIWCAGPDQMGHHYMLHALPLFISTGLTGLFLALPEKLKQRKYLYGLLPLFLIVNSLWALWFSPTGVWPNDNGRPGLLSAPRPPVIRSDYDEWRRLADYLMRSTTSTDRIMMVGSSFVFNQDLLRSVYVDQLGAPNMFQNFVRASEIDHEEPTPLDVFASATIYLVPEPAQYHLDPAGQKVVTAAAQQFPPPPERTRIFHADDTIFHLADGVSVKIWRREAWTPSLLYQTMSAVRLAGPQDADFLQGWAATKLPLRAQIRTNAQNFTYIDGLFNQLHKDLNLFFLYPLPEGKSRIAFSIKSGCANPQFELKILTGSGQIQSSKRFVPEAPDGTVFQSFSVSSAGQEKLFLGLNMSVTPAALCRVELNDLSMGKEP